MFHIDKLFHQNFYNYKIERIFCDVNPIPIKEAMKILGYDTGYLRGPLTELTTEKENKLEVALYKYHSLLTAENRAALL